MKRASLPLLEIQHLSAIATNVGYWHIAIFLSLLNCRSSRIMSGPALPGSIQMKLLKLPVLSDDAAHGAGDALPRTIVMCQARP